MGLARRLRRLREKNEEATAAKKRRRKMLFEPLEPRVLLSADLKFAMTGAADDVKLQLKELDGVETLQLIDMSDQSLLQSQALADTSAVIIEGSAARDLFTVDLTEPFSLPIRFTDDYSGDGDTLKVMGLDRTWSITGADMGRTGDIEFSGIENLIGGSGDDSFIVQPDGAVSGYLDGAGQATAEGDSVTVIGDGSTGLNYRPDAADSTAGQLVFDDGRVIAFRGLEPTTVHDMSTFTFTPTGSHDVLTIDSPAAGQNRISGTSDGNPFEAVTFYNIQPSRLTQGPMMQARPTTRLRSTVTLSPLFSRTLPLPPALAMTRSSSIPRASRSTAGRGASPSTGAPERTRSASRRLQGDIRRALRRPQAGRIPFSRERTAASLP